MTRLGYQIPNFTYPGLGPAEIFRNDLVNKVRTFVSEVNRPYLRNLSFEARVGHLDEAQIAALTQPKADLASIAGRLNTKVYANVVPGDAFRQVAGRDKDRINAEPAPTKPGRWAADPSGSAPPRTNRRKVRSSQSR